MKRLYLVVLAIFTLNVVNAQYQIDNDKSTIIILGSSNLTEWNQFVDDIDGSVTLEEERHVISAIHALELSIPVSAIKSGQQAMDQNAQRALKIDDHPTITFTLQESSVDGTDITLTGIFNVAGVDKETVIHTTYSSTSRLLVLSGELELKMTDFGIEPPTALMGAMKTHDNLLLEFSLVFER